MMVCSLRSNFTTTTKNSIVSLAIYVDINETTLMGFYVDIKWINFVVMHANAMVSLTT